MNRRKIRFVALAAYLAFAGLGVLALQPASRPVIAFIGDDGGIVLGVEYRADAPTVSRPVIACIGGGGIVLGAEYRADAPTASRSDEVGS